LTPIAKSSAAGHRSVDRSTEIAAQQATIARLRAEKPGKIKPNKPQLPAKEIKFATLRARSSATGNCIKNEQSLLQLATAKNSPPKQPNSNSTKRKLNSVKLRNPDNSKLLKPQQISIA